MLVWYEVLQVDWYCNLFCIVGEDWLWFFCLYLFDDDFSVMIIDFKVEVYFVCKGNQDFGLFELNFCDVNVVEFGYFGIYSSLIGNGIGCWLMLQVIDIVFVKLIEWFFLYICMFDSFQVFVFYKCSGFCFYKCVIEVLIDLCINGMLLNIVVLYILLL